MLRSIQFISPDRHDQILKNLVEFWIQELNPPEGAKFDEQTLREALLKRLQIKPQRGDFEQVQPSGQGRLPEARALTQSAQVVYLARLGHPFLEFDLPVQT